MNVEERRLTGGEGKGEVKGKVEGRRLKCGEGKGEVKEKGRSRER